MKIQINEIYKSIQGESSYSGIPCIFIRFTYCNLRCSYCDTEYAFYEGKDMTIEEILEKVESLDCNLVEITGGEPLLQDGCIELIKNLEKRNHTVLLETGGALPINKVSSKTHIILDIKCPSSKMDDKNYWKNIKELKKTDEVKFVIGDKADYNWSKKIITKYDLTKKCSILMSPVYDKIKPRKIVEWILKDNLEVRFQLQIHKEIWDKNTIGV
tara:strand:- start:717 stop:1358 length:642 start_codon:yes stop_codon:yes gene_type:complete